MTKKFLYATPLLATSLATCWLGALVIGAGLHGLFAGGAILSRRD